MRPPSSFKEYFIIICLFKVELFFSIAALFGFIYLGSETSSIYVVLMTVIGVLNIGFGLFEIVKSKRIQIKAIALLFGFPAFVLVSLILGRVLSSTAIALQRSQFNSFLAFSLPSLFIGMYIARKNIDLFIPISFIMVLITAGSISSIFIPFLLGRSFTVMGGASYQTASYYTSFAFGLNLYILFYRKKHLPSRTRQSLFIPLLQIVLLLMQAVMVIIPGGRGAFVLMVTYTLLIILKIANKKNVLNVIYGVFIIIIVIILLNQFFPRLMSNSFFERGFNRATAFIGQGGTLNWEGSSGRLPIYQESIEVFKKSPLIGYGLYGYFSNISFRGYPHNFFLEILLQGGLIYFSLWILFIGFIAIKLYHLIKSDEKNLILLYIGLLPAVMLMFSGSYLSNGLFWFIVSYVTLVSRSYINLKS